MRDYGWEMEPLVNIAIDKAEYLFHNGLIQNAESISLKAAKITTPSLSFDGDIVSAFPVISHLTLLRKACCINVEVA